MKKIKSLIIGIFKKVGITFLVLLGIIILFSIVSELFNAFGSDEAEIAINQQAEHRILRKEAELTEIQDIAETTKSKSYELNFITKEINDDQLRINIKTNLPEGANLYVDISRIFYIKDDKSDHTGSIYKGLHSVEEGKIEVITKIDDRKWENSLSFLPIDFVLDSIYINIGYTPKYDQPKEVLNILGEKSENLYGENVSKVGNFKCLDISSIIFRKYHNN